MTSDTTVAFTQGITEVVNNIHSASNVREIILELTPRIVQLLECERLTIFAIDAKSMQLYSLVKQGTDIQEIRVPRTFSSIVGFCAMSRQLINIKDAYDNAELKSYHQRLTFDSSWDSKTGFKTGQVLASPIMHDKYLMGVIQLLNKKGGGPFTDLDVKAVQSIAQTLGIAFFNQRKMARSTKPNKFGRLLDEGLIASGGLEEAVTFARVNQQDIAQVLIEKFQIPKEEILKSIASYYNTSYFSYDGNQVIPEEFQKRLNFEYLRKVEVAPLSRENNVVVVAMEDPSDLAKVDIIRVMQLAPRYQYVVALRSDIITYLHSSYGIEEEEELDAGVEEILGELAAESEGVLEEAAGKDDEVSEADSAIVRLANQIIKDGKAAGASDIHVEPGGDRHPTRIRFRVDGVCSLYQEIPPSFRRALVSRLKIISKLDIAERRKPQDGKIRFRLGGEVVELRVATIPTQGGEEDVVMRILAASKPMKLAQMGFSDRNLKELQSIVQKPYGIILCVGPTGSGKTTTLHSCLGYINTIERKIWTAEDPVEITQHGLRQVQVKAKIGFTFAAAMRAFLRADPDVIMVGEMRDHETAHIGIEASLTGHLVFSTLHTNSAPETVTRLFDMDIDPFNFADSMLGVLAQRLGRTLCKDCKEAYQPSEKDFEELVRLYGGFEEFSRLGIQYNTDLELNKPIGCTRCNNTGYRGRCGLHELMIGTDEVKRTIRRKATIEDIGEAAAASGMTTLMQDGIAKIFQGILDLKQVRAVCIK